MELYNEFNIGTHIKKEKTVEKTLRGLPDYKKPYQIMFCSLKPTFTIDDNDINQSHDLIKKHNIILFIHAPYIINLSSESNETIIKSLEQHLVVGSKLGAKGVVVHVGKACERPTDIAIENMRKNINTVLKFATKECPLLLETPAGQGTELLTTPEEFINFASEYVNDDRFGICVDTCHVFASGTMPSIYLERCILNKTTKLKLIHFNDSKKDKGCCVDRHTELGTGFISYDELRKCGKIASDNNIPLVYE
jgi:deoxyribonuclease-4